jgi:allantoate deiminase
MIFIPSKDGLSHCPEEWSDAGHLADGTTIIFEATKQLTEATTS